ncbi:MAG: outer membrane lipoprotein-sorting protein [Deltaproteobacteria bacterium]|nr:outer membrane lipoprotein-sorting protein [Deltaproteobacteria bacterium]
MFNALKSTKLDGSESLTTLVIYNSKGDKRVRKVAAISKLYDNGATEKRLIRFLSPADVKGTGLLTFDYEKKADEMWLYMPALRKSRRIIAADKAKSFMGSEFTYADTTPPPVEDFKHKILGEKIIGGVDCWIIESVPKTEDIAEENGFGKKVSYIGKKDYAIRKAEYYDLDMQLHKILTVHEVREIDKIKHRYRPIKMTMENIKNGRKSEFTMDKIQLRTNVPDDYFTLRYLERD